MTNSKSYAERKIRPADAPPWVEARPQPNRVTVDQIRIVFGDVHDLRIGRLNDNIRSLIRHRLLRRGLQVTGFFRFSTHDLNGGHDVGLLIVIGVAQLGSPGQIFVQIRQHGRKLG